MSHLAAGLYVVATAIGNLADMSARAIVTLQQVELILCEDTRTSKKLLQHYQISTPVHALHRFNEAGALPKILEQITAGAAIALISDAGTPLISDPGCRLVRECHQQQLAVVPIPGPSAVIAALSAAGFLDAHFEFVGFLPAKTSGRQQRFESWLTCQHTLVFFEVPHRIAETLSMLAATLTPEREVVLAREMTKKFETIVRLTASMLPEWLAEKPVLKGEWVVVLGPAQALKSEVSALGQALLSELLAVCSVKDSVAIAAKISGDRKNVLYQLAMTQKQ